MAAWWGTEAVPLPVTALVPLAAFPLFKFRLLKRRLISYANPHIFLFLGGFILALAIQRSGLHKRLALSVVSKVNASAGSIVGTFMCISFFISMWVMNTSTTLMLLPICLAICVNIKEALPGLSNKQIKNFEIALFLGYCICLFNWWHVKPDWDSTQYCLRRLYARKFQYRYFIS